MSVHATRSVRFIDLCHALAKSGSALHVLPSDVVKDLNGAPKPFVLLDFAGRDSVAAAMAWIRDHEAGTLIPVADVVPTRYGDWSIYEENWTRMRDHIQRAHPHVHVAPWFCLEDIAFWSALNARFLNELAQVFGFFTPCLGCHLHFYAMRSVLAEVLGAKILLSGEKELHGIRRKANQTTEAVDAYRRFSAAHGLDHHFPIHQVRSEQEIVDLLGYPWKEGDRQLRCVMSGNDAGIDGRPMYKPEQIIDYMEHFAGPLSAHIVELRRAGIDGKSFTTAVETRAGELLARARKRSCA